MPIDPEQWKKFVLKHLDTFNYDMEHVCIYCVDCKVSLNVETLLHDEWRLQCPLCKGEAFNILYYEEVEDD